MFSHSADCHPGFSVSTSGIASPCCSRGVRRAAARVGSGQERWAIAAERPRMPESLIPERAWREFQPIAAARYDSARSRRLVLTGSGGIGKSRTLAQLHAKQTATCVWRVWIDARADRQGITEALRLGVWAASLNGTCMAVSLRVSTMVSTMPLIRLGCSPISMSLSPKFRRRR